MWRRRLHPDYCVEQPGLFGIIERSSYPRGQAPSCLVGTTYRSAQLRMRYRFARAEDDGESQEPDVKGQVCVMEDSADRPAKGPATFLALPTREGMIFARMRARLVTATIGTGDGSLPANLLKMCHRAHRVRPAALDLTYTHRIPRYTACLGRISGSVKS